VKSECFIVLSSNNYSSVDLCHLMTAAHIPTSINQGNASKGNRIGSNDERGGGKQYE